MCTDIDRLGDTDPELCTYHPNSELYAELAFGSSFHTLTNYSQVLIASYNPMVIDRSGKSEWN